MPSNRGDRGAFSVGHIKQQSGGTWSHKLFMFMSESDIVVILTQEFGQTQYKPIYSPTHTIMTMLHLHNHQTIYKRINHQVTRHQITSL